MSVHYKFKSSLEYDTVTFDGLHISVGDLKKAIVHQKRIGKNTDFDLQVTNAQTKEVYSDENVLIPKNTSLIIARVPQTAQPNKRSQFSDTASGGFGGGSPNLRSADDGSTCTPLSKAVDLSRLDASEEDKIRAMMTQSTQDYDPSNYMKIRGANQMGEVPANYRCFKCHQPGHWIKNCPLGLNQEAIEIKKSTGIPRSFMVPVEGPMVPGAMMTPTGQYAVPALDHQAYNSGGGGRGDGEVEEQPDIPEDLVCSICKDLLTDAVMIPCCGNSFCDECIRTILLESEDHECPDCHEKDISPGTLIPNRYLRNSVASFKSETGYRKRQQYRHTIEKQAAVESTTAELSQPPEKPPKIELPDFVPPPNNDPTIKPPEPISHPDQRPVISEADSTDQTKQPLLLQTTNTEALVKAESVGLKIDHIDDTKAGENSKPEILQTLNPKNDHAVIQPKTSMTNLPKESKQELTNMPLGAVHVKNEPVVAHSQGPQGKTQSGSVPVKISASGSSQAITNTVANPITSHMRRPGPSVQTQIIAQLPPSTAQMPTNEERPGTPTVDEPGVGISTVGVSYPPGETPPFVSPTRHSSQNLVSSINPVGIRPPIMPSSSAYPVEQAGPYIPPANVPPTHYGPPYGLPPTIRGPGPSNPDFNPHVRPFAPRSHYDQLPPPIRGYDPARPPPPFQGYPPRNSMSGPRPYAPRHHMGSGMRPPHNGMNQHGVIDDPLAAFERMLREKDERDRRAREALRRSRSRSYSPRGRRSLSSSRSRSYSPGTRSRSRSPPPARKRTRSRSRSPRSHSRGSVRRRSRTPRSRDRSFSISRSRSFSRSPSPRISPREYSPRRRPISRNRYRSPLQPRHSPQRYRYQDRRPPPMERDRERGYIPPPARDRDYGSYYDAPPPMDYPPYDRPPIEHRDYRPRDRDRDRMSDRIPERERDVDRDRDHDRDRERDRRGMPMPQNQRIGRGVHPPQRYLPSPPPTLRKDYPPIGMVPPVPPGTQYYSIQEHGMYHHHHPHHHPEVPPIVAGPVPNRYQSRVPPNDYPPSISGEKVTSSLIREPSPAMRYDLRAPTPPGTEQPTVPGFESPRIDKTLPISDAPPGVDPSAGDTVITGPLLHEKARPDNKDQSGPRERTERSERDRGRDNRDRNDSNRGRDYDGERGRYDKKGNTPERKHRSDSSPRRGTSSRDRHAASDKHRKHRYDSPDDRDKNRERRASESDKEHNRHLSDRRGKDSYEDDKSKKNKDKKKRKKEKEAEKTKKKEERKKRKEQEKLKKAEEKKTKDDEEEKDVKQEDSGKETEIKTDEKITKVPPKEPAPVDLYDETLKDGVDTKVIETYAKVTKEDPLLIKSEKLPEKTKVEVETTIDENDDKDMSFDGLDLHANEYDLMKPEINEIKKSKMNASEVLATLPVLSKWEMEEDGDKKENVENKNDIKSFFEKPPSKIVTSEVLKHAENAIFKKAINAIRPIEIKKISVDRAKLYSGEKNECSPPVSPQRIEKEKEPITISNIQVTIPTNDWEMRLVDINPPGLDSQRVDRERTAKRKTPPVRLSVRERLGSKVEELDKITKDDKVYDRNRSRTLSPLSRREKDGSGRNITVTDSKRPCDSERRRKVIESSERVSQRRDYGRSRNTEHERRGHSRTERSRSRDRSHRDRDSRRTDKRTNYRRDEHGDDSSRREVVRRSEIRKPERKDERRDDKHDDRHRDKERDDKHNKDKKKTKRSRSRSESSDKKSVDRDKRKKKDKKHKKEKEKNKKHKKDDLDDVKKSDKNEEEEKSSDNKQSENTSILKKIPERRKPTLDESNFEPDYDALETDSEGEDKEKVKSDSVKKRDRSKSSEKPSDVDSAKKRKVDDAKDSEKKLKEPDSTSSDSSSGSSSSSEERPKRKHRKHKNKKKSKKVSSSSSSDSESDSSSDDDKKKKNKSKKHKSSKKSTKKKKKSKHR